MNRKLYLVVMAVIEIVTGLALLLLPDLLLQLLLGIDQFTPETLLTTRWVGVALLAIGVASGISRDDHGGSALRGVLVGVLIYNVGAVVLFLYAAIGLHLVGLLLWPAALVHAALAIWGLLCLQAASAA